MITGGRESRLNCNPGVAGISVYPSSNFLAAEVFVTYFYGSTVAGYGFQCALGKANRPTPAATATTGPPNPEGVAVGSTGWDGVPADVPSEAAMTRCRPHTALHTYSYRAKSSARTSASHAALRSSGGR